jgi:hypothetical protein
VQLPAPAAVGRRLLQELRGLVDPHKAFTTAHGEMPSRRLPLLCVISRNRGLW